MIVHQRNGRNQNPSLKQLKLAILSTDIRTLSIDASKQQVFIHLTTFTANILFNYSLKSHKTCRSHHVTIIGSEDMFVKYYRNIICYYYPQKSEFTIIAPKTFKVLQKIDITKLIAFRDYSEYQTAQKNASCFQYIESLHILVFSRGNQLGYFKLNPEKSHVLGQLKTINLGKKIIAIVTDKHSDYLFVGASDSINIIDLKNNEFVVRSLSLFKTDLTASSVLGWNYQDHLLILSTPNNKREKLEVLSYEGVERPTIRAVVLQDVIAANLETNEGRVFAVQESQSKILIKYFDWEDLNFLVNENMKTFQGFLRIALPKSALKNFVKLTIACKNGITICY